MVFDYSPRVFAQARATKSTSRPHETQSELRQQPPRASRRAARTVVDLIRYTPSPVAVRCGTTSDKKFPSRQVMRQSCTAALAHRGLWSHTPPRQAMRQARSPLPCHVCSKEINCLSLCPLPPALAPRPCSASPSGGRQLLKHVGPDPTCECPRSEPRGAGCPSTSGLPHLSPGWGGR
jgi:hypothetical protein